MRKENLDISGTKPHFKKNKIKTSKAAVDPQHLKVEVAD